MWVSKLTWLNGCWPETRAARNELHKDVMRNYGYLERVTSRR